MNNLVLHHLALRLMDLNGYLLLVLLALQVPLFPDNLQTVDHYTTKVLFLRLHLVPLHLNNNNLLPSQHLLDQYHLSDHLCHPNHPLLVLLTHQLPLKPLSNHHSYLLDLLSVVVS